VFQRFTDNVVSVGGRFRRVSRRRGHETRNTFTGLGFLALFQCFMHYAQGDPAGSPGRLFHRFSAAA